MEHFETLPLTEFDIATCGTYFQMIKAYLPYTSGEQQKMFALFIRLAELMQTLEFYKNMPSGKGASRHRAYRERHQTVLPQKRL